MIHEIPEDDQFELNESAEMIMRPSLLFQDAPGGTGKTFTINAITAAANFLRKASIICATSAVASQFLRGGRTAHYKFIISVPYGPTD